MREKFVIKSVDENGDGLDVQKDVQVGSGGESGTVTDDSETFRLDNLQYQAVKTIHRQQVIFLTESMCCPPSVVTSLKRLCPPCASQLQGRRRLHVAFCCFYSPEVTQCVHNGVYSYHVANCDCDIEHSSVMIPCGLVRSSRRLGSTYSLCLEVCTRTHHVPRHIGTHIPDWTAA